MDQYQAQELEQQALEQELRKLSEEERKEWEDRRYHLKEMMTTEGWLIVTKMWKDYIEGVNDDLEKAVEEYRIHRAQGAKKAYKDFYGKLQLFTQKIKEEIDD